MFEDITEWAYQRRSRSDRPTQRQEGVFVSSGAMQQQQRGRGWIGRGLKAMYKSGISLYVQSLRSFVRLRTNSPAGSHSPIAGLSSMAFCAVSAEPSMAAAIAVCS